MAYHTYLWKPEKLQVELAYFLAERGRRAPVIFRREWRDILEERGLLVVVPFDGSTG
jgi:hypothetical protein